MAKNLIVTFGVVFVLIGILGFIDNPIVGNSGFFMTNTSHDLVHLISGILFLIVGMSAAGSAAATLLVFGIVYALVAVLGFFGSPVLGFVDVNAADNWLHVVLAVVFIIGGLAYRSKGDMAQPTM